MQKLQSYLYGNLFTVVQDETETTGIFRLMYQRKLTIQKGFKDSIQIQFKNSDQKPLPLNTSTQYWFDMIDVFGRELVLTKPLTIIDDSVTYQTSITQTSTSAIISFTSTNGISIGQSVYGFGIEENTMVIGIAYNTTTSLTDVTLNQSTIYPVSSSSNLTFNTFSLRGVAQLDFYPQDTINIVATDYKFIIKQDNNDGTFTPAYANTYYGIAGDIELLESGFPIGFPVQTSTREQMISGAQYDATPGIMCYHFYSGWFMPFPSCIITNTNQCSVVTLDGFVGEIEVQGTLDNNLGPVGQANVEFFTMTSYVSTTPSIGSVQLSWNTATTGVRFSVTPATDGFGNNYYPTGNPIGSFKNQFPNGFVDRIRYFS